MNRFVLFLLCFLVLATIVSAEEEYDANEPFDYLNDPGNAASDSDYFSKLNDGINNGKISTGQANTILSGLPNALKGKFFSLVSSSGAVSLSDFQDSFVEFATDSDGLGLASLDMKLGDLKFDGVQLINGQQALPVDIVNGAEVETTAQGFIVRDKDSSIGLEGPTPIQLKRNADGFRLEAGHKPSDNSVVVIPNGKDVTVDSTPNGKTDVISITDNERQTAFLLSDQDPTDVKVLRMNDDGTYSLRLVVGADEHEYVATMSSGMTLRAGFDAQGDMVLDTFGQDPLSTEGDPVQVDFSINGATAATSRVVLNGRARFSRLFDHPNQEHFQRLENAVGYYSSATMVNGEAVYNVHKVDARDKTVDMFLGNGEKSKAQLDAYSQRTQILSEVQSLAAVVWESHNPGSITQSEEFKSVGRVPVDISLSQKDRVLGYISQTTPHSFFRADYDSAETTPFVVTQHIIQGGESRAQQASILNGDLRWDGAVQANALTMSPSISLVDTKQGTSQAFDNFVHLSVPPSQKVLSYKLNDQGKLRESFPLGSKHVYVASQSLNNRGEYVTQLRDANTDAVVATPASYGPTPLEWKGYRAGGEAVARIAATPPLGYTELYETPSTTYDKSTGSVAGFGGNREISMRFELGEPGDVQVTRAYINAEGTEIKLTQGSIQMGGTLTGAFDDFVLTMEELEDIFNPENGVQLSLESNPGAVVEVMGTPLVQSAIDVSVSLDGVLTTSGYGKTDDYSIEGVVSDASGTLRFSSSTAIETGVTTVTGNFEGSGQIGGELGGVLGVQSLADFTAEVKASVDPGGQVKSSVTTKLSDGSLTLKGTPSVGQFGITTIEDALVSVDGNSFGFDRAVVGEAARGAAFHLEGLKASGQGQQVQAEVFEGKINTFTTDGTKYLAFDLSAQGLHALAQTANGLKQVEVSGDVSGSTLSQYAADDQFFFDFSQLDLGPKATVTLGQGSSASTIDFSTGTQGIAGTFNGEELAIVQAQPIQKIEATLDVAGNPRTLQVEGAYLTGINGDEELILDVGDGMLSFSGAQAAGVTFADESGREILNAEDITVAGSIDPARITADTFTAAQVRASLEDYGAEGLGATILTGVTASAEVDIENGVIRLGQTTPSSTTSSPALPQPKSSHPDRDWFKEPVNGVIQDSGDNVVELKRLLNAEGFSLDTSNPDYDQATADAVGVLQQRLGGIAVDKRFGSYTYGAYASSKAPPTSGGSSYVLKSGDSPSLAARNLGLPASDWQNLLIDHQGSQVAVKDIPNFDPTRVAVGTRFYSPSSTASVATSTPVTTNGVEITSVQVVDSEGGTLARTGKVSDLVGSLRVDPNSPSFTVGAVSIDSATATDLAVFADELTIVANTVSVAPDGIHIGDTQHSTNLINALSSEFADKKAQGSSLDGTLSLGDVTLSLIQHTEVREGAELRPFELSFDTTGAKFTQQDQTLFTMMPIDGDTASVSFIVDENRVNVQEFMGTGDFSYDSTLGEYTIDFGAGSNGQTGSASFFFSSGVGDISSISFPSIDTPALYYDFGSDQLMSDTLTFDTATTFNDEPVSFTTEFTNFQIGVSGDFAADTATVTSPLFDQITATDLSGNLVNLDIVADYSVDIAPQGIEFDSALTRIRFYQGREDEEMYLFVPAQEIKALLPSSSERLDISVDEDALFNLQGISSCGAGTTGEKMACYIKAFEDGQVVVKRSEKTGEYQLVTLDSTIEQTTVYATDSETLEQATFWGTLKNSFLTLLGHDARGFPMTPDEFGQRVDEAQNPQPSFVDDEDPFSRPGDQ